MARPYLTNGAVDRRRCLRALDVLVVVFAAGIASACGSAGPTTLGSASAITPAIPRPCSFLTQHAAAQISGDTAVTIQASDVTEPLSGYVACVFTDTGSERNSVSVQIKRAPDDAASVALTNAAAFFSGGEPVQPFETFPIAGVGSSAIGGTTPGVAFIVFSTGTLLVYVGGSSEVVSAAALQSGVESLAQHIAARE
jgi:hypothetical protein